VPNIDPKLRKALSGISGILVTPFDASDKIAPSRLQPIVDRAVTAGVHMLVANGNTGEFYGLTMSEADAMVKEGRELAKIHKNIVVKVPLIAEGLKATKRLTAEGIKVNVTLCFSPTQALLAAKAGAWCVSPFIGRLDDISSNGMELIRQIVTIYKNYDFKTYVLVASVRHPQHVVEAALAGGHICTMPFAIFQQMVKHPLTDIGLKKFLADWDSQNKK